MDEKVIAVIDGNSLMHRAFHAVQTPMNAPDGRPTNACFGFMSMLLKLVGDFKPNGIIAAFDAGIPPSRLEAVEAYKAQRPPTDPDLKVQFPMIEELLNALNIPVVRVQDYEGDDILGTLSEQAEKKGAIKTLLISGDKDVLQLVSDSTTVVTNKVGMSDVRIYDPEGVKERFGVDPAHVPDYLGLMGDTSDNIPGIPGVGPKTATKLLQEYGNIEGVIAHASELKGKLAEKVADGAQLALDSRKVATIIRDVPLNVDFDEVVFPNFDSETVKEAFGELGMMSQLRKILKLAGEESAGSSSQGTPSAQKARSGAAATKGDSAAETSLYASMQVIAEESEALARVRGVLDKQESLGVHLELPGTQASAASKKAQQSLLLDTAEEEQPKLSVAFEDAIAVVSGAEVQALLKALLKSKNSLAAFNAKEVLRTVVPPDTTQETLLTKSELQDVRIFDISVAHYLLDSDRSTDDPVVLMERYLPGVAIEEYHDEKPQADDSNNISRFAAVLAAAARALAPDLQQKLIASTSMRCYEDIEQPLTPVLVEVERNGVKVDTEVLAEQGQALSGRIEELRNEAYQLAGMEFNLDSPKQVGEVLFEKLMLPPKKKTKSGYSTDASVLSELTSLSPLPGIILEHRELAKLVSTYIDALPKLAQKSNDGLIHTNLNQVVAATGRLSSSEPNLQNIPVRSETGKLIRTAFVADAEVLGVSEAVFVSADYSQIELRLLAHLSGDEHLIEAFISGEDFHKETAARVFAVAPDEVTPEMRSRAKAVNFGIVYGQQAFGLSQSLGISFGEADEMIKRYFEAYPKVHSYLESLKVQAREQGWVETIFGRRRLIQEVRSSNPNRRGFAERTAMNHPMQGSAADIIKLAMIQVARRLQEEGYRSQMVLQVHDELDFNCDAKELSKLTAMVTEVMQNVVELKVPLVADVSSGPNWAVAH